MTKTAAKCTPCATERKTRVKLGSPLFPVEFACPHPGSGPVPGLPLLYAGDRHCPGCGMLVAVEVTVEAPGEIGYRCDRGHVWMAASPAA